MTWPHATDYNAAVQNPQLCFRDEDLRQGQTVGDLFGLPRPHSGNFADVYQIQTPDGQNWAVKCFTRPVAGLRHRYHAVSEHIRQTQRAFMVEFYFLDQGICIHGQWHPLVKMRWVDGLRLNEFVSEQVNKPVVLERLAQMWIRLAQELRDGGMAHGDLQHGNVLLVPGSKSSLMALKLIDYDGMFVPALAPCPSGEVGHANYQHPRRLREGNYDGNMDRFSHLLIYTALRCLCIGGEELWQRYDNQENLLFREEDFRQPSRSLLLRELWEIPDHDVRSLVGHLLLASQGPMRLVPTLDELVDDSGIRPLSDGEEARINDLLDDGTVRPSRDRKVASRNTPLPNGRGSAVSSRAKPQTAVLTTEQTVDAAALTDTQPILLKPAPATMQRRPISTEVDLEPPPLEPAAAGRSPFDVATLADPLVSLLSRPAWLATMGVIALISFFVVNMLVWSSIKQPATASVPRPTLAGIDDVVLTGGHEKQIHFTVERHGFRQPLTLRIAGLPDEMEAPEPLELRGGQNRVPWTFLPPLGLDLLQREVRVSLWDGDEKIDEKPFFLSIHMVPRPVLKQPDNLACQAGHSSEFSFEVQRNDCRELLRLWMEGLPPQVRQESAPAKDTDVLHVKLTIAADLKPQAIPVKLQLHVGDVVADTKALLLNIQEDDKSKQHQEGQKPGARLKEGTPHTLTIEPGKTDGLKVLLERGNLLGDVQLRLDGLPVGAIAAPVTVPVGASSATMIIETTPEASIGEHGAKLRLRVDGQTVDERDIMLSLRRPRGRQEIVHFHTVDHMELVGTLYHGWKGKQGMTVLMLHDLGRDRGSPGWKHLAEALQAEGHTVLTFDFRGHGESKKASTPFWKFSVNKYLTSHDAALPAEKQPRTLEAKDLPSTYLPWLIEDIAAARSYLDVRHDEPNGPVNTFNLVVIGAGQASALGSLWLGTEGSRYNAEDISGKTVLKPSEKLSVLQVVWLGMTDPLKLDPRGIYSWLEGAAAKPVVPITFVYGQDDIDTSSLLEYPIRERWGSAIRIPDARRSGQDLLESKGNGAERIKQYLVKTFQNLPPQPWVLRRVKTLHSYWAIPLRLLGQREEMRIYVAKRVGEETLTPIPFLPLGIRLKGLTEPQPLPSVLGP
jgi:hypothetical protein